MIRARTRVVRRHCHQYRRGDRQQRSPRPRPPRPVAAQDNVMAAGGYPWTVIPVAKRKAYMAALENASVGEDIRPFAEFLANLVEKRLAGEPLPEVPKTSV